MKKQSQRRCVRPAQRCCRIQTLEYAANDKGACSLTRLAQQEEES